MIYLVRICLILNILSSCSPNGGGFAPSPVESTNPNNETLDNSYNFKYGQKITTNNGWEASFDMVDPIKELQLANGWVVEVNYE